LGFDTLTPMQEAMLKAYPQEEELVLLSPTGSGKTLAFLLPLVQSLRTDTTAVQAVVLVPSRELALQIETVFRAMGTAWKAVCCYGGRPTMEEHRTLRNLQPAVVIGTPGRMNDHLQKGNIDASAVHTLIIDEFDKSLELGFQEEMASVITALPALTKRVLLSATDMEVIPSFTGIGAERFRKLDFTGVPTVSRLRLYEVRSPEKDKLETLYRLLCTLGSHSTLVFCNYRESVERVTGYLQAKRLPCDMFHGGMEQPDRERTLYRFRNGSCHVLVSTDLAARGLDIASVENIVHYHLPAGEEACTHRNGRTARWEAAGNAFFIIHSEEQLPPYLAADEVELFTLPEVTPKPALPQWTTIYIGKGKKDKLNKVDIVGFLYKKGGLSAADVGSVDVKDHYAFAAVRRDKAKQLLTLIRGEKIKGMKTLFQEAR
jgi:superfamily II DNA/RNA helicase